MQRRQKQIWSLQSFRSCRSAWIDVSFGLCDLYSCTSYARVSPEWLPFYASETDACVSADRRIEGSVLVMLIEVGEPYNRPNDSISAKGRNYSFGKIHVSVDPFSEREMLWVTVGCRSYAHTHTHTHPFQKSQKHIIQSCVAKHAESQISIWRWFWGEKRQIIFKLCISLN